MELISEPSQWRRRLWQEHLASRPVGFVATMGALHAGHLSLIAAARERAQFVAVSIFVNPLQFGEGADLDAYPRDVEADLEAAAAAGTDAVFAPSIEQMYPGGRPETTVSPGPLSLLLEGAFRPGHFDGVATVVTKLLSLSGPVVSFFGEKDFQQLAVVRRLVDDLDLPAEIVACPTVREPDGLALSSRNRRLGDKERQAATSLHRALLRGRAVIESGGGPEAAEKAMADELSREPLVVPDYAVAVDPTTFARPRSPAREIRLLVAAHLGAVRLIDNEPASLPRASPVE